MPSGACSDLPESWGGGSLLTCRPSDTVHGPSG